ncbi:polymerase delta-interacting protein 3-like isoform X2 [Macrosteles quadrilineatus]|uniref:polymerase delta-interacting protein 3-like isoform X2 n=1 Tax=Macrosteles quadrilineatus TaxID=74068 RepID=UPI0023E17A17|nr:polymerase delta-interacting protein 3-like isoform X2 [Macrosteles quadrilineatus]
MELSLEEIIKIKKIRKLSGIQPKRLSNNNKGVVRGRVNGRNDKSQQPPQGRGNMNPGGKLLDARMKIIQKNRQRMTDARYKLAEIAKQTDARTKIKRQNIIRRQSLRGKPNVRERSKQRVSNQNLREKPKQRDSNQTPILLQRSIKNNVAANLRDPSSMIRCTINRSASDFNRSYGEEMDIDEPVSFSSRNNYGDIQVAWKNEFTPYSRQEYIPNQNYMMSTYEHPMMREIEPSRNSQRTEPRRMSLEMRARLDTPPRLQRPPSPSPPPQALGYRIVVSNLHSSVTHEDIKELFEDIGPLLTSRLVRAGTAEVIYKYQKDAKKAVEAYHNRQLDGQPMKCLLVNTRPSSSPSSSGLMRSSNMPAASKFPHSSRSTVVPDLNAIHKALFTHK